MTPHRKNSFPLKEMHIVVPCRPPSFLVMQRKMKNNQDVNQGQLQIKEQKIKIVSAIFFYSVLNIKASTSYKTYMQR